MSDQTPSYALLGAPSFDILPHTDIELGTIVARTSSGTRRPDPKRPLNSTNRIPVPPTKLRTRRDPEVRLDNETLRSTGSEIWVHLPIVQPVGGQLGGNISKNDIVYIIAHNVTTEWFLPDDTYFTTALQNVVVKDVLFGFRKPPIFMVTGLKYAESATIVVGRAKSKGGEVGPEIDLTPFGVPLDVGVSLNAQRGEYNIVASRKENVVLAYETRRIKVKKAGYEEEDFNTFAVLDDEVEGEENAGGILNKVDIDIVSMATDLDDE